MQYVLLEVLQHQIKLQCRLLQQLVHLQFLCLRLQLYAREVQILFIPLQLQTQQVITGQFQAQGIQQQAPERQEPLFGVLLFQELPPLA